MPWPEYDPDEPASEMRRVPIRESGGSLVRFTDPPYSLRLDRPRFRYRRELFAREALAERLMLADADLCRQGYGLLILECWRAPVIQRRMFRAVELQFQERYPDLTPGELRKVVERYSAPDDPAAPPPHTTGGAVDLWLAGPDGLPADLTSPFDWKDDAGFAHDAPGLSAVARANRDRLHAALAAHDVTNYPREYWHYSFGDQGHAYRGGHPFAIFGAVEPPGWTLAAEDDSDDALEFVEP